MVNLVILNKTECVVNGILEFLQHTQQKWESEHRPYDSRQDFCEYARIPEPNPELPLRQAP
eukprot:4775459-Amphidinium_carterae.1